MPPKGEPIGHWTAFWRSPFTGHVLVLALAATVLCVMCLAAFCCRVSASNRLRHERPYIYSPLPSGFTVQHRMRG